MQKKRFYISTSQQIINRVYMQARILENREKISRRRLLNERRNDEAFQLDKRREMGLW
jgi:hypothetical protein